MKNRVSCFVGLGMLFWASAASAQIYVCKDATGHTLTSDRPIPECANRAMRELDRSGVVRREIAPPLTAEQKRQRVELEEKRQSQLAADKEQRLQDNALITRYRNETDIANSRRDALLLLGEQLRIDTAALKQETQELRDASAVAKASSGEKKGASYSERRRLEDASRSVESRMGSIDRRNAEITRTDIRFDLTLKRFRELVEESNAEAALASKNTR
jgi:hypothetical protein